MRIVTFPEANTMAEGPEGSGLAPVPCIVGTMPDGRVVRVIKWQLTPEEVITIAASGHIYVVHSGLELYPYTITDKIP